MNNPVNFLLILGALVHILSGRLTTINRKYKLILACTLPLAGTLLIISLFRETYPHWPGPAYSTLIFLPAVEMSKSMRWRNKLIPNLLKIALPLPLLPGFSLVIGTHYFPGTMSLNKDGVEVGKGDASLDMFGWRELEIKFDSLYRNDVQHHTMPAGAPLIVTKWYPASHEDFYIGHYTRQETIGIGSVDSLHQYYWFNSNKGPWREGSSGYYIVPSNQFELKTFDMITNDFSFVEMALTIPQYRSGELCKEVFIFRLLGYRARPLKY